MSRGMSNAEHNPHVGIETAQPRPKASGISPVDKQALQDELSRLLQKRNKPLERPRR